jgi:hypothetical protein
MMAGSGTFSILTSPAACMMVARIDVYLRVVAGNQSTASVAKGLVGGIRMKL